MLQRLTLTFVVIVVAHISAPYLQAAEPDSTSARRLTDSLRAIDAQRVVVTGTRNEVRLKDSPVRVEVIGQERIKTTPWFPLEIFSRNKRVF